MLTQIMRLPEQTKLLEMMNILLLRISVRAH